VFTHVINRGNGGWPVFHDEDDYRAFVALLGEACERVAMRIAACCLMPNHFHLVVWPREEGDLSRWMQWLMTSHVRRHHRRYGSYGHVWQGRFKSFLVQRRRVPAEVAARGVLERDPVMRVVRYAERNPVRAGLVDSAEQWRWSSMHWHIEPSSAPRFWSGGYVHRPDDWLACVNRPQTDAELAALRRCIARGRPFGTANWIKRIAAEHGLESTLRPRGRPRKPAKSSLSP